MTSNAPALCLLCGHERKFYNTEADACEHTTGLTKPQFDVFCGCACRFASPPSPSLKVEEIAAVDERVNAAVERMDASQKVDAATMQIELNPATTPVTPPDAVRKAAEEIVDELFQHATQLTATIAGDPVGIASYSPNYVIEKVTAIISRYFPVVVEKGDECEHDFERIAASHFRCTKCETDRNVG